MNHDSETSPTSSAKGRIAILGSGRGSNARAILEAIKTGQLSAEVALILTDQPAAGILDIASEYNVPSLVVDPGDRKRGHLSDEAIQLITDRLCEAGVEWVILAGFMKIVRDPLLSRFENRILNLHPSLLPRYPGLHTVKRAMEAGEKETGCTIHLVDSGIDTGKILHQSRVPIEPGDTVASVTAKIHAAEHKAYPMVIGKLIKQG
ncbi:phosphoribosylglycinamide formyltransferase [Verrucomicrobiales bacterium BCK34]|nr:phosphoribosylglycinamide formyltransferase [Verrucomicrobiales bacterium BCK34]